MEEKIISIKLDADADTYIEKLQEIKKLLVDIKELSKEVFNNEMSNNKKNVGLVFSVEKLNL